MRNKREFSLEINPPINQFFLYGYEKYFRNFINLFNKGILPNSIMITGQKGIGKSTFVYHFANYLFSRKEEKKYSVDNFCINSESKSYNLINKGIHPNFYLLESAKANEDIKIDQIRDLLKFLNKSTYAHDLKVILIDSTENLNKNSSNALLKKIEEPDNNTFFFFVHNNFNIVLETIKSRCIQFKIHFNKKDKEKIFENILNQYSFNFNELIEDDNFYYDTPGNLVKYLLTLKTLNIKSSDNLLNNILLLLKICESEKNNETFSYVLFLVEKLYKNLCIKNNLNSQYYFLNYQKIINHINNYRKFNLSKKNTLSFLNNILKNEKQ